MKTKIDTDPSPVDEHQCFGECPILIKVCGKAMCFYCTQDRIIRRYR